MTHSPRRQPRRRVVRGAGAPPAALVLMRRAYLLVLRSVHEAFVRAHGLVQDGASTPKVKVPKEVVRLVDRATRTIQASADKDLERIPGISAARVAGGEALVREFRARNVRLIKTLAQEHLGEVAAVLQEQGNLHTRDLTKALAAVTAKYGLSTRRAEFWAVDQTLKLNADVVQAKHQSLGIVEYVWRTSRDSAVRETHAELEGKTFRYDDPPETGTGKHNPGKDYRCRCHPDPVLPKAGAQAKPEPKPKPKPVQAPPKPKPKPEPARPPTQQVPKASKVKGSNPALQQLGVTVRDAARAGWTPESARRVRDSVRAHLDDLYGWTPRQVTSNSLRVIDGPVSYWQPESGDISIGADTLADLPFINRRSSVLRVFLHEELHGYSPSLASGVYSGRWVDTELGRRFRTGPAAIVEEASTEILARRAVAAGDGTFDERAPGAYQPQIDRLEDALIQIDASWTDDEVRDRLVTASARLKRATGAIYTTPEAFVRAWVAGLELDAAQAERLISELVTLELDT